MVKRKSTRRVKWKKKEIQKLVFEIIVLALIAIFPSKVLIMENDTNLKLLSIGIILTIVLGGYNMFKSIFKNPVVEELKEANRLAKEQLDIEKAKMKEEERKRPY